MKSTILLYFMALFTFSSTSAMAAFNEVAICSPEDRKPVLELQIKNNYLITISHERGNAEIQMEKIIRSIPTSAEELKDVAEENEITTDLVEGITYATDNKVILLARDKEGIDYYFTLMGATIFLLGTSASCR